MNLVEALTQLGLIVLACSPVAFVVWHIEKYSARAYWWFANKMDAFFTRKLAKAQAAEKELYRSQLAAYDERNKTNAGR